MTVGDVMSTPDLVSDRVTGLVLSSLLVLHALVLVWHGMSKCPGGRCCLREACSALARDIRSAITRAHRWITRRGAEPGRTEGEDCILTKLVQDAMQIKRQRFARTTGKYASLVVAFTVCTTVVNILLQKPRWQTPAQSLISGAMYPLSWYFSLHDCSFRVMQRCCYMLFVAMGAIVVASHPQMEMAVITILSIFILRFIISVFMMDIGIVCRANTLCSAMVLTLLLRREDAPTGRVTRMHVLYMEASVFIIVCACANAFQRVVSTSIRQAMELQSSRNESLAAVGILKAVCDAVVRLDDDMLVADEETKLAAILLHGPGRVLKGMDFLRYVNTEDQRLLFREWLRAPETIDDEKGAFDTALRDSTGNLLQVEMFHVPFEYFPGTLHHFIGIRESGESDPNNAADRPGRTYGARRGQARPHSTPQTTGPETRRAQQSPRTSGSDAADSPGPAQQSDSEESRVAVGNVGSTAVNGSPAQPSGAAANSDIVEPQVNLAPPEMIRNVHMIDGYPVIKFDPTTLKVMGYSEGFSLGPHGPPRRGSFLSDRMKKFDGNTEFFRECSRNVKILSREARNTTHPQEVEFKASISFLPQSSRDDYLLSLRVILSGSWQTDPPGSDSLRSLVVLGTAVVQTMSMEKNARRTSLQPRAQFLGRTENVSL